jgi:hypothetical protein
MPRGYRGRGGLSHGAVGVRVGLARSKGPARAGGGMVRRAPLEAAPDAQSGGKLLLMRGIGWFGGQEVATGAGMAWSALKEALTGRGRTAAMS